MAGFTLSISGIVMLASESINIKTARILIPLLFITSGVFSIMIANANPQAKRQSQYHMLQGVVFILFGLLFSLGAKSLADFLSYATYFILFIVLFDIIIGFTLVNSDFKWTRGNLILKYLGSL